MSVFLDPYVQTVRLWTDAPELYHKACSITVAGAALAGHIWLPHMEATTNIWCLLVGNSMTDRKSTALKYAVDVLVAAAPQRVLPDPGSYEALVKCLAGPAENDGTSRAQRLLVADEFQHLLDKFTLKYAAPMQALLNSLFDWKPSYERELMRATFTLHNAAVSLIGACTPRHIEKRTNEEFWQGGFFSRLLPVVAHRSRFLNYPRRPLRERELLKQKFEQLVERVTAGTSARKGALSLDFTPDSHDAFESWAARNAARQEKAHPLIAALVGRLALAVLKVAAIREVDTNEAPRAISEESLQWAITFIEEIYKGAEQLPQEVAFTEDMRRRRAVLELLQKGGGSVAYSTLLRGSHLTAKDLQIYLETLAAEGLLERQGKEVVLLKGGTTND